MCSYDLYVIGNSSSSMCWHWRVISSVTSLVVDVEEMSLDHWIGLVLWVLFGALTVYLIKCSNYQNKEITLKFARWNAYYWHVAEVILRVFIVCVCVLCSLLTVAVEQINMLTWVISSHYESLAVGTWALCQQLYSSCMYRASTLMSASDSHLSMLCPLFQQRCPRTCLDLWVSATFKGRQSRGMQQVSCTQYHVTIRVHCLLC